MTDYIECKRCGKDEPEDYVEIVSLGEEYELCEVCHETLVNEVEYYDWQDRYTEEHHERAVDLLSDQDEVECVISSYEDGQIIVHTPYVSSDAIADVAQFFNLEIISYGPIWKEQKGGWPCLDSHGSIFQVLLEYNHTRPLPSSNNVIYEQVYIDDLDPNDEQF